MTRTEVMNDGDTDPLPSRRDYLLVVALLPSL